MGGLAEPPVAGLGIRIYADEMIPPSLAPALRRHGYDAESCQEAGRSNQEIPDEEQLAYATQHGRAILTFNIGDFHRLDADWKATGRRHAGIILSTEISDLGTRLRRVERHLDNIPPYLQHDMLLWL